MAVAEPTFCNPLFERREIYTRKQKAIDLHQPRLGALEEAQRLRSSVLESAFREQGKNLSVLVSAAL